MTTAILDGDLVIGLAEGPGMGGVPVPAALANLPLERLRHLNGQIVDAQAITQFYADAHGYKHVSPGSGRQAVTCALTDALRHDGTAWVVASPGERLAPQIKAACTRRIVAVLSDAGQRNLTALITDLVDQKASGTVLPAEAQSDIARARQMRLWIGAMQTACRQMITNADAAFEADGKWPPLPDGLNAFAERF